MRRSRFSEEQIVGILKEQEAGAPTAELCRRHGIREQTFYTPGRRSTAAWRSGTRSVSASSRKRTVG
jgi:putative transposase